MGRGELARLYAGASGFVHAGEEDFGITMVEALAAGSPVVALYRGGARDIVRNGVDGVLVERADLRELRTAIRTVAETRWDAGELRARALEFATERFLEQMRAWLDEASRQARGHEVRWAAA